MFEEEEFERRPFDDDCDERKPWLEPSTSRFRGPVPSDYDRAYGIWENGGLPRAFKDGLPEFFESTVGAHPRLVGSRTINGAWDLDSDWDYLFHTNNIKATIAELNKLGFAASQGAYEAKGDGAEWFAMKRYQADAAGHAHTVNLIFSNDIRWLNKFWMANKAMEALGVTDKAVRAEFFSIYVDMDEEVWGENAMDEATEMLGIAAKGGRVDVGIGKLRFRKGRVS